MILSKTPFRISFFGGGSDLSSFYNQSPGFVVSAAINKYIYISLNKKFDDSIRVSYSITENVNNISELKHDIVKNALKYYGVESGVELASISDLPSNGTGMGASSAFAVGLINALHNYKNPEKYLPANKLAELACEIEIDLCKKPIGKQDQYACAYGGINTHTFENDSVTSKRLQLGLDTIQYLEDNFILLYTSIARSANDILKDQSQKMIDNNKSFENMKLMVKLAHQFHADLVKNDFSSLGEMLDYSWQLKKEVSNGISNPELDELYNDAKRCGAKGGKVLGAGGGGFMLLYADPKTKEKIKEKFYQYKPFNFKFDFGGPKILQV